MPKRLEKLTQSNFWYQDHTSANTIMLQRLKRHITTRQTKYQKIDLVDTFQFGLVVILDNKIQSAELDEHIYHEALVHPAMITHPKPEKVLILGGGEGATLREVLKHPTVKKVVMVDIDKEFVDFCREHLRKWHMGSFDDPRAKVVTDDALKYINRGSEQFDIIIADISDPISGGPATQVYTKEFYSSVANRLRKDGIFVTQAVETTNGLEEPHTVIYNTMSKVYKYTESYSEHVHSFSALWAFLTGSGTYSVESFQGDEITRRIRQRKLRTRHYCVEIHRRMFLKTPRLKRLIKSQERISTSKKPLSVFDF